jgi:hypothetical protein
MPYCSMALGRQVVLEVLVQSTSLYTGSGSADEVRLLHRLRCALYVACCMSCVECCMLHVACCTLHGCRVVNGGRSSR